VEWASTTRPRQPSADDVVLALEHWRTGAGLTYERLADALLKAIRSGELQAGCMLPSERRLAHSLGIGRGTVAHAYHLLEKTRAVGRRQGSGTVVLAGNEPATFALGARRDTTGWIWEEIDAPTSPAQQPIDLASTSFRALPSLPAGVLGVTEDELRSVVPDHGYLLAGLPTLRSVIAEHLEREGLPTTADQILVTTGALQAIALVGSLALRRRDVVLTESPTYPTALDLFGRSGAHVVTVRSSRRGIDLDQLQRLLSRAAPALVYLVATSNPAHGGSLSERDRHDIADLVRETDALLLDDRARADFETVEHTPLAAFGDAAQFLTVGSISKLYWGGLRVGWLRASPELVRRVARLKAAVDLGSAVPSQLIAGKLLLHADAVRRERLALLAENYGTTVTFLSERLPDWQLVGAPGPSAFIRLPRGDGASFARAAASHGVTINPGSVFCPDDTHANHIRVSLTAPTDELIVGLTRLEAASRDRVAQR
jgi:DNA-binding transcriptional MocR family regulator